jgi:hypothetical protein
MMCENWIILVYDAVSLGEWVTDVLKDLLLSSSGSRHGIWFLRKKTVGKLEYCEPHFVFSKKHFLFHNAGQNHNVKLDNKSFESVEQFKYLGTTVTNRNSIQEEIKSRLKSRNACYDLVQILCLTVCCTKIQRLRYTEL